MTCPPAAEGGSGSRTLPGSRPHMTELRSAIADAPFTFVVGKGGTGKTTAAAALALELADSGTDTHLISTDPAHSLRDVFAEPGDGDVFTSCSDRLRIEEFSADRRADSWLARALAPVTQIVEGGTYLDAEDVSGFTKLALPGLDEVMAVLRLVDLIDSGATVVVDTAPTGHTLRLLDAGDTHEAIARALRAMAEKAAAVASSFARRAVRLSGEDIIDELEQYVARFREEVLLPAAYVVAARGGTVVEAETARLTAALQRRGLRVAATVFTGAAATNAAGVRLHVPLLPQPTGCDGLRAWRRVLSTQPPAAAPAAPARERAADAAAAPQLLDLLTLSGADAAASRTLLVFAGKGGVGKSTCAAAAALEIARTRPVLLCSADPAGSLHDVLGIDAAAGDALPNLRVLQIDAEAQLAGLREQYRGDLMQALERIGLTQAAALDRRVIDALWDLAPPGIDEFAALAALLAAAANEETIVLDTAPTGHFLRLLTMPQVALDWVRQVMRILVKYHAAGAAGGAAESLLQSARELRGLQELLHDPVRSGIFIVTLEQPVVAAETGRLAGALHDAGVPVAAIIHNRAASASALPGAVTVAAPECATPPVGAAALREFAAAWKIVT